MSNIVSSNSNNIKLNTSSVKFSNYDNVINRKNIDLNNSNNSSNVQTEEYDLFDAKSQGLQPNFSNSENTISSEIRTYVDRILLNNTVFTAEERKILYSSATVVEAQELLIDMYEKKFADMYGFTTNETSKMLNSAATFEEIFNSDYRRHMNKYLQYSSTVFSITEEEKERLLECNSWEKSLEIFNDIDMRLLMESGFFEADARRILNGETSEIDLYNEIMSEETDYRRYHLIYQSLLVNEGYSSMNELAYEIVDIENRVRDGNKNLFGDETYNEYYWTMELIGELQNSGYTTFSVEQLNEYAGNLIVGYSYVDDTGNTIYSKEDPNNAYSTLSPEETKTLNTLYYKDIFGLSTSYANLENHIKGNQVFFNDNKLNTIIGELNTNHENVINDYNAKKKELEELTNELFAKKNLRDYIISYAKYYTDNVLEYTRNKDFNDNCNKDVTITSELDRIFDTSNYKMDELNDTEVYKDNSSIKYVDSGITRTLMIEDKETVMQMIYSMISGEEKIRVSTLEVDDAGKEILTDGLLQIEGSDIYLDSNNYPILASYLKWAPIMTETEKECFYYKYNTEGFDGAYDYLIDISQQLDDRWVAKKTEQDQRYAEEHPVLASIASVIATPGEGFAAFCYSMESLITGEEMMRTHVYSSGDVYRSKVASDIALNYGTGWSAFYNVGMSMADTAVLIGASFATGGSAIGNTLCSASLMGTRSYGSTLNHALDLGMSDGSAIALAFSSSIVETMMESYSVGHLLDLENKMGAGLEAVIQRCPQKLQNVVRVVGCSMSQGFAEGEEELCTSAVNFFAEQLIAGELSGYTQSIDNYMYLGFSEEEAIAKATGEFKDELIQSFVGGFTSGMFFGAFSGTKASINISKETANKILTDYNAAEHSPTNVHEIRKSLRKNDYEAIITQVMSDSNININKRVEVAERILDSLETSYAVNANTKERLASLVNDFMNKGNVVLNSSGRVDVQNIKSEGKPNKFSYAYNYLQSNVRKFSYKDTSDYKGLNQSILENGLYHFTNSADAILSSGYIKSSGYNASYGNKKTFFFNGIPEVGAFATNLDSIPIKTTAVRVKATNELVNNSKLKVRYSDDMAISYDGDFSLNGYETEKCYFCLFVEDGKLVYKEVSESTYNYYQMTDSAKAIQEYVSNKKNLLAIKYDFLTKIKNMNDNIDNNNNNNNKHESAESVRVIDQEHGFQLNKGDLGEFFKARLESGFFTETQIKTMLDNVNQKGYISESAGNYYSKLFDDPNYDIYIKTVHSSVVDSIMREGIRCLGSSTSGYGMTPTEVSQIDLENTVTSVDGLYDLAHTLKNAIGISQGGNPINGTIIIKIPKGMNKSDMLYFSETSGTFCIKPEYIECFSQVDQNGVVSDPRFNDNADIIEGNNVTNPSDNLNINPIVSPVISDILNKEGKNAGRRMLLLYSKFGEMSNIPVEYKEMLKNVSPEEINSYLNVGNNNIGFQFFDETKNNDLDIEVLKATAVDEFFASLSDNNEFDKLLKKIQNMNNEDVIGFSSVAEYKEFLIDKLFLSGKINDVTPYQYYLMACDEVMVHRLIGTEKFNGFIMKNLNEQANLMCKIFKNLDSIEINRIFNDISIKEYVNSLSNDQFERIILGFMTNRLSILSCDTFKEKILNMNDTEYKNIKYILSDEINSYFAFNNKSEFTIEKGKIINLDKYSYYTLVYEYNGNIIKKEFNPYDDDYHYITHSLDSISNNELLKALLTDNFKILDVQKNEVKSTLFLTSDDGIQEGLNKIKVLIDGVEHTLLVDCSFLAVDLNYRFKDVSSAQILSVENIKSSNVEINKEDANSLYKIECLKSGSKFNFVLMPTFKKDSYVVDVDNYLLENNIYDASDIKIEKIDINSMDFSEFSITKYSAGNDIFVDTKYGGNQSDVKYFVADYVNSHNINFIQTIKGSALYNIVKRYFPNYVNSHNINSIQTIKGRTLYNIVKQYFPNATDMQVINIAESYANSGCAYMAISNAFCTYLGSLENGNEIFNKLYGIDLYIEENGKRIYNYEVVALDIFCDLYKAMKPEMVIASGGGLSGKLYLDFIPDYFSRRGLDVIAELIYLDCNNTKLSLLESIFNYSDSFKILSASGFDLELLGNDNCDVYFNKDGSIAHSKFDGKLHKDIGGHGMIITGVDQFGDIIVSSWSNKYKFVSDSILEHLNRNIEAYAHMWTLNFNIKEGLK